MKYTKKLTKMELDKFRVIFWDFDGVIKDSVDVKTWAFESLFSHYGAEISKKVRIHHEANGGMSRFEKIPLYMKLANIPDVNGASANLLNKFSELVLQGVIDSPWVPGVHEYLKNYYSKTYFVLLTATPECEIGFIVNKLGISKYFREIHGSPKLKVDMIADVLERKDVKSSDAIMIGDSEVDMLAAKVNSIPFLLRRTPINLSLQAKYAGPQFNDLLT
jgi:phosphoglycolate phosphatase-like HAD superfamily hydrolase